MLLPPFLHPQRVKRRRHGREPRAGPRSVAHVEAADGDGLARRVWAFATSPDGLYRQMGRLSGAWGIGRVQPAWPISEPARQSAAGVCSVT